MNYIASAVQSIDSALSATLASASSSSSPSALSAGAPSSVVSQRVASLVEAACLSQSGLDLDAALPHPSVRTLPFIVQHPFFFWFCPHSPREVAFCLLKYVNNRYDAITALNSIGMVDQGHSRNHNARYEAIAKNALNLLDMLVKNCGHPFHLIIATKEFLNELVKRFPERPGPGNPIQFRILELIQQWNATLCVSSRYREDLKNISDMYRLLAYKGYRFPEMSHDSAAVLSAPVIGHNLVKLKFLQTLKSEEELEEEDRIAQGAKLQELLRVGTPSALAQANELMKILSGYEQQGKPDYKQHVDNELDRIEAKATELNNMFEQPNPSQKSLDLLVGATKSAQNRIQSLISNGEQEDRIERLLSINDYINMTLENYQKFRSGQPLVTLIAPTRDPSSVSPTKSTTSTSPSVGAINLIDFDDATIPESSPFSSVNFASSSKANALAPQVASGLTDLKDLEFFGPSNTANFGGMHGFPSTVMQPNLLGPSNVDQSLAALQGLSIGSTGGRIPQTTLPVQNAGSGNSLIPNLSTNFGTQFVPITPQPPSVFGNSVSLLNQSLDSSFGKGTLQADKTAAFDFNSPIGSSPTSVVPFTSSGIVSPPQNHAFNPSGEIQEVRIFNKNGLQIKVKHSVLSSNVWHGEAVFINTTPVEFSQLKFQIAVPKVMQLNLQPISGTVLAPLNQAQIVQKMSIVNMSNEPLKVRFKVSYDVNGALVEESGEHTFGA
ncbi:hypothetical protein HDU83_002756 [Entophlyctis luteolus]|nr:hypothetical protein HDU83_002756 [Entophlyctis luteolus]